MTKPLWLLNIFFTLLSVALAAVLVRSIAKDPLVGIAQQANTVAGQQSPNVTPPQGMVLQLTSRLHPISEYDAILRGTLFNDPPADTQEKMAAPVVPLPALQGTIFVGGEAKALLTERGRQKIYGVGERVGGGTLGKIEADRVVIDLGNRQAEIFLKSTAKAIPPPSPGRVQAGQAASSKSMTSTPREEPERNTGGRLPSRAEIMREKLRARQR